MRSEGKILHILGWDQKFVPSFIEFVQENFASEDHYFIIHGGEPDEQLPGGTNVTHYHNLLQKMLPVLGEIRRARKVVLHGLFSSHLYYALALQPSMLGKCYWVIWGGDLYIHTTEVADWRHLKNERFRRFVISRLGHVVTHIKGDYDLARQWYGARGAYHYCLMYPSNVVDPQMLEKLAVGGKTNSGLNFLVGNSANKSNGHIEILERLLPYKECDITIYVPLSYGDQRHAAQVVSKGREWFGKKFIPLTSFMTLQQYVSFLGRVDIAIFNHKRQQAMGVINTLLGLGKAVYMRSDVTSWDFYESIGMTLFDINDFSLSSRDDERLSKNKLLAAEYFSKEKLSSQLSEVFR